MLWYTVAVAIHLVVSMANSEACENPMYAKSSHFDDIYLIKKGNYASVTVYTCSLFLNGQFHSYTEDCNQSFLTGVKYVAETNQTYTVKINGTVHYSDKMVEGGGDQPMNISITLSEYTALVNPIGNEIKLRSGTICRYNLGGCFDPAEYTDAIWNATTSEENISPYSYTRIFLENTTSYVITLNSAPLIRYAIIDKENETFALQLLRRGKVGFKNTWYTNVRDLQVAFKSENFEYFFNQLSTVDPFLEREISLDMQPKELVYNSIMNNCFIQSRLSEINNFVTPTIPPPKESSIGDEYKLPLKTDMPLSKFHFNIENVTDVNATPDTISDSTLRLLGENFNLIVLISSIIALFFIYILYNIILNCCLLQNIADQGNDRNYIFYSLSQALTLRYIFNSLQNQINILKIRFFSSPNKEIYNKMLKQHFNNDDYYHSEYERPLTNHYEPVLIV